MRSKSACELAHLLRRGYRRAKISEVEVMMHLIELLIK